MDELRARTARSPLAGRGADLARISAAEVPFLTQIDVRCGEGAAARLGFPLEPNTVTGDMARGVLWLGPDEWLVVSDPGDALTVSAKLSDALAGEPHSLVDVSANRTVLELRGADRLELLATGCSLDLDPAGGWGSRRCAQTLFGRAQVLLQEIHRFRGPGLDMLTQLERQILEMLQEGAASHVIAARLSVERTEVKDHVQEVLRKLGTPGSVAMGGTTRLFVRPSFAHDVLDRLLAGAAVLPTV